MKGLYHKLRLDRALAALVRAADIFPLTLAGSLIGAACLWVLLEYGIAQEDYVLLAVGAGGLALVAVSLLVALALLVAVKFHLAGYRSAEGLNLDCGFWARTSFELPTYWFIPFVSVQWRWESPKGEVRLAKVRSIFLEEIRPYSRCMQKHIVRRFEIGDIFGLVRFAFRWEDQRNVRIVPSVGALKQMHVVHGMSGGADISHPEGPPEGDYYDMRRYVPGDPIRFVLWKVFAKSRALMVRRPERAIAPSRQTVAYLVAGKEDEPAAGAARVAVDTGILGSSWVLGSDGSNESAKTKPDALNLLARSAGVDERQSGAGLAGFLRSTTPGVIARTIVFVPAIPGPWVERVAAAGRSSVGPAPVDYVICTDGIHREKTRSWWSKALKSNGQPLADGPTRPTHLDDLKTVVRGLSGTRAKVFIVDRVAGRIFNQSHLNVHKG